MDGLLPLFVAIPLLAGFLGLLAKKAMPALLPWISVACTASLLLLALAAVVRGEDAATLVGGWGPVGEGTTRFVPGIVMVLDGLSRLFLLIVGVVSTAAAVYALRYLAPEEGRPLFHVLFCLLVAGMNGAVLAGDLFNLFVFVEVASIASYGLVAYRTGGLELEAAFKYLVLGTVASTAILVAIAVLYAAAGYLSMADVAAAVSRGAVARAPLLFASALFLVGFGLKAALVPFHAWLPDAHPSAPAPISAVLSGLLIKTTGVYALVRVLYGVVGLDERVRTILLVLGGLSMVVGVLLAIGQDDLKRLLAYSSVSQMGFVVVALATNTAFGVAAGLFHAMNHSLYKSALFLSSGSLERIAGTRNLSEMGGLARRAPWTALGTLGAALSISGIPPFNGFWSKLFIVLALFDAGLGGVGALAAAVALLTLVAFVKVQRKALFGPLPDRLRDAVDVPRAMSVPVLALALLCLLTMALWPLGLSDVVDAAAASVRAAPGEPSAVDAYVRRVLGRQP